MVRLDILFGLWSRSMGNNSTTFDELISRLKRSKRLDRYALRRLMMQWFG